MNRPHDSLLHAARLLMADAGECLRRSRGWVPSIRQALVFAAVASVPLTQFTGSIAHGIGMPLLAVLGVCIVGSMRAARMCEAWAAAADQVSLAERACPGLLRMLNMQLPDHERLTILVDMPAAAYRRMSADPGRYLVALGMVLHRVEASRGRASAAATAIAGAEQARIAIRRSGESL